MAACLVIEKEVRYEVAEYQGAICGLLPARE